MLLGLVDVDADGFLNELAFGIKCWYDFSSSKHI